MDRYRKEKATDKLPERPEASTSAKPSDILRMATKDAERGRSDRDAEAVKPDPISHEGLTQHYTFLLQSRDFWNTASMVNSGKKIILTDTIKFPGLSAYYDDGNHTIYVSLHNQDGSARAVEEIRDCIGWEVRNATMRGQYKRIMENFSEGNDEVDPFRRATYALSCEWTEWANIMEHAWFCRTINEDPNMGEGGPHIIEAYRPITKANHPWYDFRNYLKDQQRTVIAYDPDAKDPSWVGHGILSIVEQRYPASLLITDKQVQDWLKTKSTRKIKSPSNNPFNSLALVEQARQQPRTSHKPWLPTQ